MRRRLLALIPLVTFDVINAYHYYLHMIKSYADKTTEQLANGEVPRRVPKQVAQRALVRLVQLDSAVELLDLRFPQSNRLEKLHGDRKGQHSIRINDQWRICFNFNNGDAYNVAFTDYH
jgi:proteic killer suppression protein